MLEKNLFGFCDAHFHLVQCTEFQDIKEIFNEKSIFLGCTCAHEKDEFTKQKEIKKLVCKNNLVQLRESFGIHPQFPVIQNADLLENLLSNNEIDAIGEAGFDLYNETFKDNIKNQEKAWYIQLELAKAYRKTLIIHCRKGLELIFRDKKIIKDIPAVLFHSFCGGMHEVNGILGNKINAYFSFGKQIMKGNKKAIECISFLPIDRLLLETDAPFQTMNNEKFTKISDIMNIYDTAISIRKKNKTFIGEKEDFNRSLINNFNNLFS